ncbi:hypothetical protein LTR08_001726 [Meristemomyces frigidus]|nr:hypothetical protein LTR08_001726 [Meristemomyces frigidus]
MDHPYLVLGAVTLLGWLLYTAVYRLYFHPLAHIPGPRLAALSTWYECYYDCFRSGGGQYTFKLKELHKRYGPIIRPTPSEVHVSDPEFLDTIYAMRNRNHPFRSGLMVDQSVGGAEDFNHHKLRREAMNPFFSVKAVLDLEPRLTHKRDKITAILDRAVKSKLPLNLSDVFFAFSNDILRSYSFGSDNGLLDDLPEAHRQRESLASLLLSVKAVQHFKPVFSVLGAIMPLIAGEKAIPEGIRDMVAFRNDAGRNIEAILADKTNDNKGGHSIFYELRDSPILPPLEKTASRLQDEATLLVMAGTESTAKSLAIATFYLLSLPDVFEKLRSQVSAAKKQTNGALSLSAMPTLRYLSAIIWEANRLSFGVTGRSIRYSPTETLTYTASYGPNNGKTYVLPPRTWMSTVTLCTHTNESLYPDPWRFDPERWLGASEEVDRRKRHMHSLGKGHRKCIGINVANAAISLVLAAIVEYDITLFETKESDIKFKYDFQISHPELGSKGVQAVVEGKDALRENNRPGIAD